jgi:C2 domain
MTSEQIEVESLKPSTYWIEAGTGYIGKLYLEIIGCTDLPNMDNSLKTNQLSLNIHREKTDAFACIVYEDVIVNTDVITNTLSPRWMPWCHRAFVFNILHPSSDVYIGIFDYDPSHHPMQLVSQLSSSNVHDPIGRIVVNLSHFHPNTSYLLHVSAPSLCVLENTTWSAISWLYF